MASKVLKDVLERVELWPEDRQEEAARVLIEMEEQEIRRSYLTDEQAEEVARRLADPNRRFIAFAGVRKAFQNSRA